MQSQQQITPIPIGNQKQLFVDDLIIETLDGLQRTLHEGERTPHNPVVWGEQPWETMGVWIYGSVLRDEQSGQYKMWYQSNAGPPEGANVCYATSDDGIHWQKPAIGAVEFRGSKANNIVWGTGYWDAYTPSVVYDPHDPDPQRRYKLYTWDVQPPGTHVWPGFPDPPIDRKQFAPNQLLRGLWLATSPDGIHFTPYRYEPLVTEIGDVLPTIYDEQHRRFVSFTKINHVPAGEAPLYRRCVGMSVSSDGLQWSKPRLIITPDGQDDAIVKAMGGERMEFYGLSGFPYEGIHLGFLWAFSITKLSTSGKGRGWDDGPMHIQLAYSRDGEQWQRPFSRSAIIPGRPIGNFDHCVGAVVNRPLILDDEIWVYYSGNVMTHGYDAPPAYLAIGLAKFRRDGFISLSSGPLAGTLLTKPFTIEGKRLELNVAAQRGWARAALVQPDGTPIAGFTEEECDLMTVDRVRCPVSWRGATEISGLRGQAVRLRITLRHAHLYAFQVL